MAEAGATLSAATESESGGTLTLNGITLSGEGTDTPLTISDMTLTEQADGSVLVRPGASIGLETQDEDVHVGVKLAHEGLTVVVRETGADGMAYDFAADRLNLVLDTSEASGSDEPESVAGTISADGLRGTWSDSGADARDIALKMTAAKLGYDFAVADPSEATKSVMSAAGDGFDVDFTVHLPAGFLPTGDDPETAFPKALEDGFALNLAVAQGNWNSKMEIESNETGKVAVTTEMQPASSLFRFDRDAFLLSSDYGGLAVNANADAIPVPVNVTAESFSIKLQSPVVAVNQAADYVALFRLAKLAVNDEVWGLLDPGGALKHEPLDLVIDLGGKLRIDLLGIATAAEEGREPPVPSPQTLDIREITLKVAGASLAADGAFTFDNTAGFPMPLGMANVIVTGANQLVDGLVAIGLVPEDEAAGLMMMAGMFLKPGSEPDTMTSTIEAKEGGVVLVNGMQIMP